MLLELTGMRDVKALIKARIPVVKCLYEAQSFSLKVWRVSRRGPCCASPQHAGALCACLNLTLDAAHTQAAACAHRIQRLRWNSSMHDPRLLSFSLPQVDVTLNNHLAVVNTKLLTDYAAIDGRLAQLVFVVKAWAKARNTNDAYRSARPHCMHCAAPTHMSFSMTARCMQLEAISADCTLICQ